MDQPETEDKRSGEVRLGVSTLIYAAVLLAAIAAAWGNAQVRIDTLQTQQTAVERKIDQILTEVMDLKLKMARTDQKRQQYEERNK